MLLSSAIEATLVKLGMTDIFAGGVRKGLYSAGFILDVICFRWGYATKYSAHVWIKIRESRSGGQVASSQTRVFLSGWVRGWPALIF